jgi:dUTP pyrophosphatase
LQALVVVRPEDLIHLLGIPIEKLDCAGLKLTIKRIYKVNGRGELRKAEKKIPQYIEAPSRNNAYFLKPGAYIVRYNEYVRIPNGYIGLAIPRSSLLRMGATIHTAVWDPGYEGMGVGLLIVYNNDGIIIEKNTQVAQLVYLKMSGLTKHTYEGVFKGEKE